MWAKAVSKKYGLGEEDWIPKVPSRGNVSNIWRDICSVGDPNLEMGEILTQGLTIKAVSGRKIKFWDYIWIGEEPFKTLFPRLYNLSTQKEEMVAEVIGNIHFRRILFGREREQFQIVTDIIDNIQYLRMGMIVCSENGAMIRYFL